jgi:membrane dipeptidase
MKHFGLNLICLFFLLGSVNFPTYGQSKTEAKAVRIHKKVFTVDSHCDTPMNLFEKKFNLAIDNSVTNKRSKVDLPRMKQGGLDAIFFAAFESQGIRTPEASLASRQHALLTFDSVFSNLKRYKNLAGIALTPGDAYALEKEGKRAIFLGVENGYPVGNDLRNIELFYNLGARYITLCHSKNNDICTSSTDTNNTVRGLSDFGRKVVEEMNRLGIMIDVSHISDKSFYDVLQTTKVPVIASHSCARAMCGHPRNLSDEMLKALAANGGVIQLCLLSEYIKTPDPNPVRDSLLAIFREKFQPYSRLSENDRVKYREEWQNISEKYPQKLATVQDACNHIDHIVKVAGIDHVGIGSDFDGGGGLDGCNDVSQIGNITLELVKRGYPENEIRKIWGGNLMRVLEQVEKYGAGQKQATL